MFAYVGGYTTLDRDGRGNGINVFHVDPLSGAWTHRQHVGGLENPSLFTLNRAGTRLYCVHGGRTLVSAFAIDVANGRLTLLNQVDCHGNNPVDSALDPSERFLVVANYGSGSVVVAPIDDVGRLLPPNQRVALEGTPGPDPDEQSSSHPHGVTFDPSGNFVIVPDKGLDRTFLFRFANGNVIPTAQGFVASRPGAAPRHATFHPSLPILYVNNELDSTVAVFDWDPASGQAMERQVTTTIPGGCDTRNTTAEIAASACGRCLYVSNRGQDSIARFDIASDSGLLTYAGAVPSGGGKPRFFALAPDNRHLFAANQDSDAITVFAIDRQTGNLLATPRRIGVGSPSAISFVVTT
jgi:6-phosphogluconolactonase